MSTTQPSPTPILDLQKPLPKPFDEIVTGKFAALFLALVACAAMTENYPLLAILLAAVLVGFLATLVHELGHLLAGSAVGFRFDGVSVGPFVLKRQRTHFSFRVRPRLASGCAYMSLNGLSRIRRRVIILGLGGPFASLLCGLAAVVAGEIARAYYDSPWPSFTEFFGAYSLLIGFFSFTPYRAGPYAGDGLLLRALFKSKNDAKHLILAHGLGALKNKYPDSVNWNRRWVEALNHSNFATPYQRDWSAYQAAQDTSSAAPLLERCLARAYFVEREYRPYLIAEAVKFCAWDRDDFPKAQKWLDQLRHPERLDLLSLSRMNIALACGAKDFEGALRHWHAGLALIQKSPSGPATAAHEASWFAWKAEIEKRAAGYKPARAQELVSVS